MSSVLSLLFSLIVSPPGKHQSGKSISRRDPLTVFSSRPGTPIHLGFPAVSRTAETILDGLRQPEYCGGITEVAKGLWMRRADLRLPKLFEHAARFESGAVTRRLGYLLELFGLAPEPELDSLRESLTATYVPLDPILPREGPHLAKWRLQINVSPEELQAVRST
jgi:predicted transcriptional regulator of viral defense system